jgi:DNA-binding response OmpR family regulator
VVEVEERLQDKLRDGIKHFGYRVFLSADPARALDRYRQQAYDALVVNAGTTGEAGLLVFDQVRSEAARKRTPFAAVVILGKEQKEWVERGHPTPGTGVLVQPVTMKQLHLTLQDLLGAQSASCGILTTGSGPAATGTCPGNGCQGEFATLRLTGGELGRTPQAIIKSELARIQRPTPPRRHAPEVPRQLPFDFPGRATADTI